MKYVQVLKIILKTYYYWSKLCYGELIYTKKIINLILNLRCKYRSMRITKKAKKLQREKNIKIYAVNTTVKLYKYLNRLISTKILISVYYWKSKIISNILWQVEIFLFLKCRASLCLIS